MEDSKVQSEQGFKKVAVLGLGLIGGSFAYALHEKYPDIEITAYDPASAAKPEFIESAGSAAAAVKGADLVVLASPPGRFSALAKEISPYLEDGVVVTDVGSVKSQAIKAIAPELPEHAHYVPGHPIAGKTVSGLAAAEAGLFEGNKIILTPQASEASASSLERVKHLWQELGADVETMPPAVHDRIYAYVSHLPHLVAFAMTPLIAEMAPRDDKKYARFTRLTQADTRLWADICVANASNIESAIDDFNNNLRAVIDSAGKGKAARSQADPAEFAAIIGRCLNETAACLEVRATNPQTGEREALNPLAYAGAGFKDMTAFLHASGEKVHAGEAAAMCKEIYAQMKEIKRALHNPYQLQEVLARTQGQSVRIM